MTLSEEREDNQLALPQSAGIGRRMIAFAMDFILLTFVAILILFYLPELLGKQTADEFSRLSGKLIEAFEQPEPDQEHVQRVMMEFSEFSSKNSLRVCRDLGLRCLFLFWRILLQWKIDR